MEKELFIDVILPLAVPNTYTYSVPVPLQNDIKSGQRVVVQFGKKKLYTALVCNVHHNKPELYKTKPIENILDADPIVNDRQFEFWKWIAGYYMCTLGEVMNAALPSGLKLSSETKILLNNETTVDSQALTDDEYLIYEALQKDNVITLSEAEEIAPKSTHHVIKSLIEKRAVVIYEELKEKFKPKTEEFVRLAKHAENENNLKKIFKNLEKRAFKQLEVLMEYVRLAHQPGSPSQTFIPVKKNDLIKKINASAATIHELVKKNIFEIHEKETGRFASQDASSLSKDLSDDQKTAINKIKQEWSAKEVVLFHGVTSSGKTEIYVRLIEETLLQGKQALYLLPEIALTTQVVSRIKKYFGDTLGVYHSKLNENERVEVWNEVASFKVKSEKSKSSLESRGEDLQEKSKFQVVLGARSALFLPYSNLGLVIVDEEHDASYKQFDPAPRYQARDAAILLAHLHKAKVLLGSATPSLESFYNARQKKYGFVELNTRFGGIQLPEILIADIKEDTKRKKMKSHFSPLLMKHMEEALSKKEQIILFQNRRGFAPHIACRTCGWIPVCKNCDVSLVYHKSGSQMRCHYCGYMTAVPSSCSACGSPELQTKNFGTEKIEEELQIFFPEARISRMDYDSARSRFAHERLITDFEERNIDILVGTQMITKGLDFDHVSLVGILNADQMIHFPDFRSGERSFQMLAQVSGRSGRKNKRGTVILQTYSPLHPVIQNVMANDYARMYAEEIAHRKNFQYPPFFRLIELTVINKNINTVNAAAAEMGKTLKNVFGKRVLGPGFPIVPRIKNLYHKKLVIKIEREESASKVKDKIRSTILQFQKNPMNKYLKIQIDVDPI